MMHGAEPVDLGAQIGLGIQPRPGYPGRLGDGPITLGCGLTATYDASCTFRGIWRASSRR